MSKEKAQERARRLHPPPSAEIEAKKIAGRKRAERLAALQAERRRRRRVSRISTPWRNGFAVKADGGRHRASALAGPGYYIAD